ncbi:hypothetical protein CLF_112757 [Clonorchis sinensis]|uniref:Saposin B-type domain-containing protein n=1 Tax=Clonorchis sinensis TaxID=79923 RepID=G7YWY0_CLOSI|nr:hypothetical protein CLF_112757 [Clonorchis sinensis]
MNSNRADVYQHQLDNGDRALSALGLVTDVHYFDINVLRLPNECLRHTDDATGNTQPTCSMCQAFVKCASRCRDHPICSSSGHNGEATGSPVRAGCKFLGSMEDWCKTRVEEEIDNLEKYLNLKPEIACQASVLSVLLKRGQNLMLDRHYPKQRRDSLVNFRKKSGFCTSKTFSRLTANCRWNRCYSEQHSQLSDTFQTSCFRNQWRMVLEVDRQFCANYNGCHKLSRFTSTDLCDECKTIVETIRSAAETGMLKQILSKFVKSVCDLLGLLKYLCIYKGEEAIDELVVYLQTLDPEEYCKKQQHQQQSHGSDDTNEPIKRVILYRNVEKATSTINLADTVDAVIGLKRFFLLNAKIYVRPKFPSPFPDHQVYLPDRGFDTNCNQCESSNRYEGKQKYATCFLHLANKLRLVAGKQFDKSDRIKFTTSLSGIRCRDPTFRVSWATFFKDFSIICIQATLFAFDICTTEFEQEIDILEKYLDNIEPKIACQRETEIHSFIACGAMGIICGSARFVIENWTGCPHNESDPSRDIVLSLEGYSRVLLRLSIAVDRTVTANILPLTKRRMYAFLRPSSGLYAVHGVRL